MSKPNVLVTGGAGYIGSHAVLALKGAGWTVSVIDKNTAFTGYDSSPGHHETYGQASIGFKLNNAGEIGSAPL